MVWHALLAQPDPLSLPAYGICGICIAGLSAFCLRLWNRCNLLTDQAIARERETADSTIPLLVKAVELLSATSPHIDRAMVQEDDVSKTLRRVDNFLAEYERRERR